MTRRPAAEVDRDQRRGKCHLQPSLNLTSVASVSPRSGSCETCVPSITCPLSQVRVGTCVRIKQLLAAPDQCQRLRELGIGEEQQVRLLLKKSTVVCEVCNVRLGLSTKLADSIWVEPLPPRRKAA